MFVNPEAIEKMTSLRSGVKLSLMKKLFLLLLLFLGLMGIASADDVETNILKLKTLNACKGCNLQGANLKKANLSGTNLYVADLMKANLSGATLCNTITPWGIDNSRCY